MKATVLDVDTDCPICDGTGTEPGDAQAYAGSCPRCAGTGTINRYRDGPDGKLVLTEVYEDHDSYSVVKTMTIPIRSEQRGGFEGRFSNWQPQDVSTGPMADYQADMKDQLQNKPLGASVGPGGGYDLPDEPPYNGATLTADVFGGSFPADPDLDIGEVVAWCRGRGDEAGAKMFEALQDELGL